MFVCRARIVMESCQVNATKKHFGVIFAKRENRANKIRIETVSFEVGRKKI